MKKALLALAAAAFASTATAQIAGSPHDLSGGYNGNAAQLGSCQFCHAPHYGNVSSPNGGLPADGYAQIPLWNRRTPNTAAYSLYTNVAGWSGNLGTGSYTCLSCHDGVSDMGNTFRGTPGFAGAVPMRQTVPANIGGTWDGNTNTYVPPSGGVTDLRDDHPVGVFYSGSGAGYGAGGNNYNQNANVTAAGLKLYSRGAQATVECGSCHDPHNQFISSRFLRIAATALCGTCHLK